MAPYRAMFGSASDWRAEGSGFLKEAGAWISSHPLMGQIIQLFSSPEHEVLMVSYCGRSLSVVHGAASTVAFKAYSSYTPGPTDSILGRKHRGDL